MIKTLTNIGKKKFNQVKKLVFGTSQGTIINLAIEKVKEKLNDIKDIVLVWK